MSQEISTDLWEYIIANDQLPPTQTDLVKQGWHTWLNNQRQWRPPEGNRKCALLLGSPDDPLFEEFVKRASELEIEVFIATRLEDLELTVTIEGGKPAVQILYINDTLGRTKWDLIINRYNYYLSDRLTEFQRCEQTALLWSALALTASPVISRPSISGPMPGSDFAQVVKSLENSAWTVAGILSSNPSDFPHTFSLGSNDHPISHKLAGEIASFFIIADRYLFLFEPSDKDFWEPHCASLVELFIPLEITFALCFAVKYLDIPRLVWLTPWPEFQFAKYGANEISEVLLNRFFT